MTLLQKVKQLFSRRESLWLLFFAALPLLAGSYLSYYVMEHVQDFRSLPFPSKVYLFTGLSVLITFSFIPNTLAGLLSGYIFGFWGLAGMILSYSLASLMGYFLGRKIDSGLKETIFQIWPKAEKAFQSLENQSTAVVMAFRLMPAPPFAIGNLLLAWFRMPLRPFLMGSLLGMLPRMALVVWVGSQATDIWQMLKHPMQVAEIQWITFGGLAVVLLGIVYWFGRRRRV